MKVIEGTNKNFDKEVLKSDIPVLVDFNATWCGPCRMLKPVLEELSEQTNDYKIVSVDVDDEQQLAKEYGILSIPCLIVFKDGKELKRNVGFIPKDNIQDMMEEIK